MPIIAISTIAPFHFQLIILFRSLRHFQLAELQIGHRVSSIAVFHFFTISSRLFAESTRRRQLCRRQRRYATLTYVHFDFAAPDYFPPADDDAPAAS